LCKDESVGLRETMDSKVDWIIMLSKIIAKDGIVH